MRHIPGVLTLILSVSLSACDGKDGRNFVGSADLVQTEQQKSPALDRKGWGPILLGLVPERGDQSTPSLSTIRAAFKDCGIKQEGVLNGRCDLSGGAPSSPDAPSVGIEIDSPGGQARAIRLSACCSADENFFQPIEGESVIRTELICPELTIVSSETVQAFRVSSSGKRDFVYARGSRTSAAGRRADLTVLLSPVELSDECSSLAAAHARFGD